MSSNNHTPEPLEPTDFTADALWPENNILDPHFAQNVPNLQLFKLANNLRVLIMSDPADRSTYMHMMVNAGAIHQPSHPRGVAHFMEHYLFNGTQKFTQGFADIADFTKEYNLDYNGFVGTTEEGYYVEADNDAESVDAAATFLSEIIFRPTFPEDKLDKEKGVIVSERKGNLSKPSRVAGEVIMNHFFEENHPLAGGGITGTEDDIAAVTYTMLTDFYRQYFNPANLLLVLVGGLSTERYLEIAQTYFGQANPLTADTGWQSNPIDDHVRRTPVQDTVEQRDFKHVSYYATYYLPKTVIPRFSREYYALLVAEGALSTRMFLDIRDKQGLAYHTAASMLNLYSGVAFAAFGEFSPENYKLVKPQIDQYIFRLFDEPITDQELKRELRALKSVRWANNARDIALWVAGKYFKYGQLISPEGLHYLFQDLTAPEVNATYHELLSSVPLETIAVGAVS